MERLREILREFPNPAPVPTGSKRVSVPLNPRPKAVLFSVYGTLLCSQLGDPEAQTRRQSEVDSFVRTAIQFGFSEEVGHYWHKAFFDRIEKDHQECNVQGIIRAEVLVEYIWRGLITEAGGNPVTIHPREVAMYREMVANPVAAFSGASATIQILRSQGILVGLASNSQFYTLPILEHRLGASLEDLFDPGWLFLSYRLGFAKPDPHFFRVVKITAMRSGLDPEEVLMVGNDLQKDVKAARLHGLQAVLFDHRAQESVLEGDGLPIPIIRNFESLLMEDS